MTKCQKYIGSKPRIECDLPEDHVGDCAACDDKGRVLATFKAA